MIEYKLFNYLDKECEDSWKNFEKKSCFNFYQSFEYIKKTLTFSKNQTKIIFIYLDKELVAILPFEIRIFFGFKILQWVGNNKSDYCNPLISEKFNTYIDQSNFNYLWKEITSKIVSFDLVFLNNQPSKISNLDNPFVKFLINIKKTKIYRIELNENFNKYLISIKNKDKGHAYELHRVKLKYEKLKEHHKEVNFQIHEAFNNLSDLNLIFFNKKKQLDQKNKKHFLDDDFFCFYKNLIINNRKNFYLAKLMVNNELLSACLLIVHNETLYYYLPVILSDKYNKLKPGKILIYLIIKWAILKNIKYFDFGLGEESYKRHFSNSYTFVQKYVSHHKHGSGVIHFLLKIFFFLSFKIL